MIKGKKGNRPHQKEIVQQSEIDFDFFSKRIDEIINNGNDKDLLRLCNNFAIMDGSIKATKATQKERNKALDDLLTLFYEEREGANNE